MKLRNISAEYIGAIKPELCKKIISLGLSEMDIAKSSNISLKAETKDKVQNHFRNSEVIGLNDKRLYDLFFKMMKDANISAGWNWHIDAAENMQFTVYKGSKENSGFYGWHIDHIKPVSKFNLLDLKQQKRCFNYKNLQPLWAKENFLKSDK